MMASVSTVFSLNTGRMRRETSNASSAGMVSISSGSRAFTGLPFITATLRKRTVSNARRMMSSARARVSSCDSPRGTFGPKMTWSSSSPRLRINSESGTSAGGPDEMRATAESAFPFFAGSVTSTVPSHASSNWPRLIAMLSLSQLGAGGMMEKSDGGCVSLTNVPWYPGVKLSMAGGTSNLYHPFSAL